MAFSQKGRFTRRHVAKLGGGLFAGIWASPSEAGGAGFQEKSDGNDASDIQTLIFPGKDTDKNDDAQIIQSAVDSLPSTGGVVRIPSGREYNIYRTIEDNNKPIIFEIGCAQINGPNNGPIFHLGNNGSSIIGSGPNSTIFKLSRPKNTIIEPKADISISDGKVISAKIAFAGDNIFTTPIIDVEDSSSGDGAALIASVNHGVIKHLDIVASGKNYLTSPQVKMLGGGECAIRIDNANHCLLCGFTIDMSSVPNAVGILQYGGWYVCIDRIDVDEKNMHPTAIALLVDSHTLEGPGKNGSYGGAYVGSYSHIIAKRTFLVGHDQSTVTTLHFNTLDAANLHIHGAIGIVLTNTVLQGSGGAFLDLVNVDGLSMIGGDIEGSATVIRSRGSCNNIRLSPLAYSATGQLVRGAVGSGWCLDLAKTNSRLEGLRTGSAGSAGIAYQNAGWHEKHRIGIQYSGDCVVYSSNIKLIGPYEGELDNPLEPGIAMIMTVSGKLILRRAEKGAGRVALRDMATFDEGGLELHCLPSSRPAVGSKRIWYDPEDEFRLKFQP